MEIIINLIRHGMTKSNKEGRFVGSIDEPLIDEGRQLIKSKWSGKAPIIEKLYSSPMKRSTETASIIYPDCEQQIINDLRECDFGKFEGKVYEELIEMPEYRSFRRSKGFGDLPDGERNVDFRKRTINAFYSIIDDLKNNNINNATIVCHGGVIMSIMSTIFPTDEGFYAYHATNGGGYKLAYDVSSQEYSIVTEL